MKTDQKLRLLRAEMAKNNIDAVIIPTSDPHQSEYVSDHWQERAWISGFTGSAGTVVVTRDHAGLWTDSRYFLQGEMELKGSGFELHKMLNQFGNPYTEFLASHLTPGSVVGLNGFMFSKSMVGNIQNVLAANNISVNHRCDLITSVWQDRPAISEREVSAHEVEFCGKSVAEKLADIRSGMKNAGADYYLLTTLDDIGWSLNIRGTDVDYNPVAISYAIIGMDDAYLFIHPGKLNDAATQQLKSNNIKVLPYDSIISFLNQLDSNKYMLLDPDSCSQALYEAINARIVHGASLPKSMKAIKNPTEIKHIRTVMMKDGAALANAFYWMEQMLSAGNSFTEVDLAHKLSECRSQQQHYQNESFGAIIGYRSNGAIIHYHPMPDTCKQILPEGILLVDSGGQYRDGTTDITRTFTLSNPSDEEKTNYTLVLKGMIALSQARFPEGTAGVQLDILARQFLWQKGLNYGHGTGHGVGFFMNVHEPPQGFVNNFSERGKTIHVAGMLTSNEPGFYKEGSYGMRIENLILSVPSGHEGFLEFETVTLYPFDLNLTDIRLLSPEEKVWINTYHNHVFEHVSPYIQDKNVRLWFKDKCGNLG